MLVLTVQFVSLSTAQWIMSISVYKTLSTR